MYLFNIKIGKKNNYEIFLFLIFHVLQQKMFYKGKDNASDSRRSSRANGTPAVENTNDVSLSKLFIFYDFNPNFNFIIFF